MTPTITMHWVAVTGPDGELRLEAHWSDASAPHTTTSHAA